MQTGYLISCINANKKYLVSWKKKTDNVESGGRKLAYFTQKSFESKKESVDTYTFFPLSVSKS